MTGSHDGLHPGQLEFYWTPPAVADAEQRPQLPAESSAQSEGSSPPPPAPRARASIRLAATSPALLVKKKRLAEIVERFLRDKGVPYIAVDEAKKALFAGAKLRSFHFVVYRPTGKNWLLWAAKYMNKDIRQDLVQWQTIFGDGFVTAVAKQSGDGTLQFKSLEGTPLQIDGGV